MAKDVSPLILLGTLSILITSCNSPRLAEHLNKTVTSGTENGLLNGTSDGTIK